MSARQRFTADLRALSPSVDGSIVERLWEDLVARHGEPGRRYHTLAHATRVRDDAVELGRAAEVDEPGLAVAAWYHDAVYQRRSGHDEAASAELAGDVLAAIGRADLGDRVRALVLATVDHRPSDAGAGVLVDADLAVLAASPLDYERYRRRVRDEYWEVPDRSWRRGRRAVLVSLLDRGRLFWSSGAQPWEGPARRNLLAELARSS